MYMTNEKHQFKLTKW